MKLSAKLSARVSNVAAFAAVIALGAAGDARCDPVADFSRAGRFRCSSEQLPAADTIFMRVHSPATWVAIFRDARR
jgi:hypothetical protein